MFKLLIVDDEISTLHGLRDYVDWDQYEIEVCGTAEDGAQAMELIELTQPDIILTDVKMPILNGIELAKAIHQERKESKIIFISGHDNIEFFKSAIQIDAVDYILKPIDFTELDKVFKKAVQLLREDRQRETLLQEMNIKLNQSMPLLREKFLMSLVRDGAYDTSNLQGQMELLEMKLAESGWFSLFVISLDSPSLDTMKEKEVHLLSFAVLNICQEIISQNVSGYAFEMRYREFVCLIQLSSKEEEDKLFTIAKDIHTHLLKILKFNVTIGVGQTVQGFKRLPHAYSVACEAASQKLFLGKNKIITMDSLEPALGSYYRLELPVREAFEIAIKTANENAMQSLLQELFLELARHKKMTIKNCQKLCLQLILIGSDLAMELQVQSETFEQEEQRLWETLFKLETVQEMEHLLTAHFTMLCKAIDEKRKNKSSTVIDQIKAYIHEHYNERLVIEDIAKQVYLTSTYLCLIFKQETDETIHEYMTKVRIQKAKELLQERKYKLYDICYAVGYTDPGYFSKLFKRHTGFTPSEYREEGK